MHLSKLEHSGTKNEAQQDGKSCWASRRRFNITERHTCVNHIKIAKPAVVRGMAHQSNPSSPGQSSPFEAVRAVRSRGAASASNGPFLGTDAKYEYTGGKVDPDTGEITGGRPVFNPSEKQVERFMLQSVARKFLPKSRTDNCLRVRQGSGDVRVLKSIEHKTAHFGGLQTCGSVWACPVCSAKIAERRRAELIAAMAAHRASGGFVPMLTLTAPHQFKDKLADLLAKQARALRSFWSDRVAKSVFQEMGIVGQVRAAEVTHGRRSPRNNGWHPHYHVLLFGGASIYLARCDPNVISRWEWSLSDRWAACCVRAGLGVPSREHGLKLDHGDKAAKYVAKWGLEDEMTKGHTKKSLHGETPFDFLRAYLADSTDKQAGALFKEFAETFKGKRQLHWSKGLKQRYAIGEKTDIELAAVQDDSAVLLGSITIDQWRDVLAVEGRGLVLFLAVSGGWDAVALYLASIKRIFAAEPVKSVTVFDGRKWRTRDAEVPESCL